MKSYLYNYVDRLTWQKVKNKRGDQDQAKKKGNNVIFRNKKKENRIMFLGHRQKLGCLGDGSQD